MTNLYDEAYRQSIQDPETFWGNAAEDIHWYKKYEKVLDDSKKPMYRWFAGGELNTCYNALDVHIDRGRGDRVALIYDSPVTQTIKKYTYRDLRDEVAKFAGVLVEQGVVKGDRVVIYMPMIPEAAVAMLACARIGAIHSVVFGGFAAKELATRINDATPKVIVSASCGIEVTRVIKYKPLLDEAISLSAVKPEKCIIFQRPQEIAALTPGRDIDWAAAMTNAQPVDCVPVAATDPLYILYTSGTTGQPKGVVRDNGGHAVALKWTMKAIYDIDEDDVWWAASDVGWVVGHSYIVYAPLFKGCTSVFFEGKPVGTPDAGVFWRVISQHRVKCMFTAPTAYRAIKREDPKGLLVKDYDMSSFKILFLAGERSDPDTIQWSEKNLNVPVIDHWWQTETGWAIAANCMGLHHFPVKYGSPTKGVPGWDVQALDESCNQMAPGEIGALSVKLPLPPGTLTTLWQNDRRFVESYMEEYPGYYKTADAGYIDDEGYVYVMSRTDDIINVAGHRLSTGAMEEVLADHPEVAECAVLGVADNLKGQIPIGFLVLNAGVERSHDEIIREVVQMVRERIGPVAAFKKATVVKRLPKTRSGKILRGTIQKIADNQDYNVPATIDDPTTLGEMAEALSKIGLAKARQA
ncbi:MULTISPECIES: propionyl-CoA synthetase [Desulfococcus]|jgi:propionyl-CoA synthetase|uniref:AMP-dependent synthetase and ligase n=1 Tax=Desulfococcus multivorans DSM 2059 TaxID=1121405 RepID=S7TP18_DESML|nr:propionyl-CoA synthetase [Desulfococcus multivorans]AOY57891.1 AMP-dependent synthetase and ligase [Desulfococcus multivorans]AQV00268.1 propionyl-CoA synthetase [Desulfococcus multivorans]EPR38972.1 AMP-dependent synthetase and ligase [Desulfococcus multivorans DSM 2059]MDX9817895.1 propionyl-CoA synthetase [Desulfococcus multivorans]SJZ66012.1 propionyl-CoA synthetase [Desulfococcus multivorans DSM 2059]